MVHSVTWRREEGGGNRHRNHPAILAGLLAQYNPGKVMFHNAACGGDQNARIAARLADRGVYRGYMYDELWKRKYDVIILFLGQNDTVAFKESNYTKPQFPIATEGPRHLHRIPRLSEAPWEVP